MVGTGSHESVVTFFLTSLSTWREIILNRLQLPRDYTFVIGWSIIFFVLIMLLFIELLHPRPEQNGCIITSYLFDCLEGWLGGGGVKKGEES